MSDEPKPQTRQRPRPAVIEKLDERRERHRERHVVVRVGVVMLGTLILLAGLAMTGPVPGPGILIIPIGLALLALEFVWAERLLEKVAVKAEEAKEKAAARSRGEKIAGIMATVLGIAAFVTAAILWDIPVLPV